MAWLAVVLAAASLAAVMVRVVLMFVEDAASLRRDALTDQLAGLGNRRALMRRLQAYFATPVDRRDRLALVLLDLDGFKSYNDRFGHLAGDALLARLASSLRDRAGSPGAAFRIGGDEFCALIPTADLNGPTPTIIAAALSEF
jgi:diguanylate cyclase (GGDEF)-like protein